MNTVFRRHILLRLAWRHARRRPLQSVFLIVGVAIGVAMIVAIDLANGSANRAFALGTEQITGRATHQIVGGPTGLDAAVYTRLRRELGVRLSAPVVESYVSVPQLDAQPMRLLGIDPFAEPPFRNYLGGQSETMETASVDRLGAFLTPLLVEPNSVLLGQSVAERYGLGPGQTFPIRVGAREEKLTIIGLLAPADELSRRALDGLLIVDISTAQEILGKVGRLDRIDLILPAGAQGDAQAKEISQILPSGTRIVRPAARTGVVAEMTAAFRLNLTALSLLALVVGMFLIYNTVSFSVVQRRPVLGILRSLGMTRREVFAMILTEAASLGLIGTLLGLGLGVILGRGAVQAVTQTINDLFFVVAVRGTDVPVGTLAKGALSGIGAALAAAALPAYEATDVPPAGAMQRSHIESKARRTLPLLTVAGLAFGLLGAALLIPDWNLALAFAGLFAVILGAALVTPAFTLLLMGAVRRMLGRFGILSRMAPRNIVRSLSRTGAAIAALMVAVSVIIGVGVMIVSFRLTVEQWLDEILQADIFVSAPALGPNRNNVFLAPELLHELSNYPQVSGFSTSREVEAAAFLPDGTEISIQLAALLRDLAGTDRRYRESVGDTTVTWEAVESGGVVINETMANRYKVDVGQALRLLTDGGEREFTIVGVTYDFDVHPTVLMADSIYRLHWNDTGISTIALIVQPGINVDETVNALRRTFAGRAELVIRSNRGVRDNALEVFDRTFAITVALRLLATFVAFVGILSTLMSLQLERAREVGVLRANGMTRRQVWALTLFETGLLGVSAGLAAIPTGFILALILIYIINLRSFGWTLTMQIQSWEFVQAFAVALAAALLAGIYPAWRTGTTDPAEALRME